MHLVESLAFAGRTPWHSIGNPMGETERRNVKAAMTLAGLDWDVATVPLNYEWGGIKGQAAPDSKGIVRIDTGRFLGTVGKDWTPVQNGPAMSLLEPLVDMGCTVEVMGALNGGRTVFGLVRMPNQSIDVAGNGDDVDGYALVKNAHDGSSALKVDLTPVRVVCWNTLTLAANSKHATAVSLRHSSRVGDRLKDAAEVVERMGEALAKTGDTFSALARRELRPKDIAAYIDTVLGIDRTETDIAPTLDERAHTIAGLVYAGKGNARYADKVSGDSTLWAAYNAVTEYFDHVRPVEAQKTSAKLAAAESAAFGGNARIKANALTVARQLVAA